MTPEHVDVLVIGAGLSGIGAAVHLQTRLPRAHVRHPRGRDAIGGTWDLFRYPGVRSDSDMYTLGYGFKPWRDGRAIADGPAIRAYIHETAAEHGVDRHVRFGHRVTRAEWSSADARWTVDAETADGPRRFTAGFVYACTGYYATTRATPPSGRAGTASRAASSTRSTGPRTSTTPGSAWW
jgi:cation diffusion facilitator CzcD-associated flavoprotein CzcO